jgi:hypothetical protein
MAKLPSPNWAKWTKMKTVHLWEGVALSANVEPSAVPYWDERNGRWHWRAGPASDFELKADTALRHKLADRLDIVANVCGYSKACPFEIVRFQSPQSHEVLIEDFAAWALSMEWEMPEQLAKLAEPSATSRAIGKWPWGDYETQNLRMLEQAVTRFWANWKEGDPDHLNKTVQAYLVDMGMDAEPASQVATLIRPDTRKKGGRPRGA